jgi:subtilisin family serine protease
MKKLAVFLIVLMLLPLGVFTSIGDSHVSVEYILGFKEDEDVNKVVGKLDNYGITKLGEIKKIKVILVRANEHALAGLTKNFKVSYIEKNHKVYALKKPAKPGKPQEPPEPPQQSSEVIPWGVEKIISELVWENLTDINVKVAVLDTGIDLDHPDLNVINGATFVRGTRSSNDDNGHGTHVAGTIGGIRGNDIGVVGVAPGVDLYAVKVLDKKGRGSSFAVANGIVWAYENDMDVINMSLGSDYYSQTIVEALSLLEGKDIIAVAASGNDGSFVDYPAAYPTTIAVGAVDSDNNIADFSSNGTEVDVVAPGVNILSTYKDGQYVTGSGTSMATPHVSGVAVLFKYKNPNGTLDDFRKYIETTSIDLGETGKDNYYGFGLVDANGILNYNIKDN